MDQAPKPELSRPRWRTRHKKLVIAGCGLISIVLLLAVAILFFIRSGRLDRYIASQVKSALAEYGLRTEIGGFDLSWGARTAKVRDVKIYNQQTGQLLVSLGRAEIVVDIPDLFALRLKRQVIFKRIDLTDLQAYLSLDQQGRSNLQGVHGVSPSAPGPITFDFSSLVGSLNRGAVYFKDQQHQIECQLTNLKGKAAALPAGSMVALELVSTPETGSVAGSPKAAGQVNNQGRTTAIDSLNFHANAGEAGADILNFTLTSPAVEVKTNGRLDNWASIRYNLAVQARVTLGEISRVLALENEMEGSAAFDGHIGGEGLSYRVTGGVSSDELAASGAQVHGAKIDDISVQSDGKQISFETKQVHVNNVALHGTALSGLTAAGLRGVYTGGRIQAGLDQVGVQRVSLAQGNVDGIKLEHLQGTLQDGNYKVTAGLDIDNGLVSGAQIGKTSGQLVATNNRVDLNKFNAVLMGGSATGDLSIVTEGQGASSLKAALTKLDTRDLFKLGSVSDAPIAGTADVQAQVTWPGTDFNSVSGAIKAQLRVSTTATKNAIPVRGTVDIAAQSGTFNINRAELDTDNSKVVATGQLSLKGDSNLHLSLSSTRAEELQTIAYSIDDLETDVKDYKPQIGGEFRFQGRVTGKLKDPAVEGDLTASSIGINDQALGSLSGHVVFSPTEVGFQNGVLAVTEGGSAKFSYMAPRATAATDGRLDATIDRINIAKLIASAGVSTQQTIVAGEVTGEAHLTGLPGTPTGSAVVNLVNATVLDEPAQTATASLTFDGKAARLDRVDLKLTQGQMSAAGTLDLKSNVFQVQGRADNVDLGRLAESFKLTNPQITGMASATFQATGNTKDLGDLNVQASAQGQNVMVSGQAAGELSLTAKTNSNGRVDAELTTGIAGKPQLLRGSIELRGAGRPIDVQADFVDLNLEPLLLAFAPDVAPSLAGSLSGKLHVTGPIVNEKDEVTPDGLRGSFVLSAVAMQAKERQVNIQTPLTVSLNGSELALTQTRISGQGFDLKLGGTIGLGQDAKMDFGLAGTADLTNLVPVDPDVTIGGSIAIDARIGGTVSEPRLSGGIQMKGLAYSDPDYPIAFDAGNGRIVLAGEKITLEDFTANVNDGAGDVKGSMTLTGLRPTDWQVTASAKNIDVLYAGAAVTLNSDLTLVGNPDGQLLSGTVTMPEGEYTQKFNLDSFSGGGGLSMGGSGGETEPGSSGVPPIVMDIQVNAPSAFLIRNDQINTVASAALNLGGTVDDPNITGRVEVEGGTIKFRSERFDIDTGTLDFLGSGETPTVNVLTEGDVSSYHCYVGLQGPIDDMDVTLRSDPELPRSEILSLVATGKTSSDTIGGQQMVESGLGTAGSLLSSTFISQPAQSLLGLNRFEIDPVLQPNANPAARITIGRQLTHDLSFTYSTNVTAQQDQSAIAEYTLSNRLSGVASYTQGGNVINGARTDSSFSIEVRRRSSYSLGYGEAPATGAAPAGKGVPTRPVKAALPRADVQIENPAGIKLSGRKLEELLPVKKEGFSRALGRLGLSNLTNYLQEQGYFFAKVTQRCDPADCTGSSVRLIYDVQPGERYDLEQIRLDGTKVIELDDVSGLRSRAASFLGGIPLLRSLPLIGGSARGITSDDRILDDRNTIRGRLAELGYRSAKVTSQINRKPESQEMTLVFHVDTGPQSLVSQVEFSGNTILSSPELMRALPIKGGAPFSPSVARSGAQAIKSQYAAHGYLDTKAQYRLVDVGKDRVGVVYSILEGERAVVSDVAITGQTRTNEGSIRRFLAFKNGDLLTPSLIRQSQRALYATGAFSEVNIRNEQSSKTDAAARRVTVQVTEARPLLFVYGAGYSTDEGPRGLLQISDSNLFGKVNSASFRVRASRREQLFQTQFTDLRPFGSQWALTLSAFYDRNTDLTTLVQRKLVGGGTSTNTGPGFGIDRLAAFIQTERKLSAITAIHFRYTFENTKLSNVQNIPVEEIPRNVQAIRLGMLSAGFTQDTRDSALNPTKGRLLSLEHSIALRPLGGSEAYNKFFLNYQRYHTLPVNTPFFRDSVLAFSGRLGLSAPFSLRGTGPGGTITEPDTELPISERFFAGGATTLRGFGFDQAGPQGVLEPRNAQELPTLVPIGGDALVILNFELRYPLTKQLRLVPFYDLGNVFPHVSDLGWKGMTHSLGMGLRFNTPVGPVGVDYGYLLNPPSFLSATGIVLRQPHGAFHITFGQTF